MSSNSDSNIATADALTLLLHNQHALGAAIEEITNWISGDGADIVADNAVAALGHWIKMQMRLQRRSRD